MLLLILMHRRLRRFAAFALVSLSFAAFVPQGIALCIAADGHVAIEASHGSAPCSLDAKRHHDTDSGPECVETQHHACNDFSLSAGAEHLIPAKSVPAMASVAVVSTVLNRSIPVPPVMVERATVRLTAAPPALQVLRTIVLTI